VIPIKLKLKAKEHCDAALALATLLMPANTPRTVLILLADQFLAHASFLRRSIKSK
jgi:hypothetical protein